MLGRRSMLSSGMDTGGVIVDIWRGQGVKESFNRAEACRSVGPSKQALALASQLKR